MSRFNKWVDEHPAASIALMTIGGIALYMGFIWSIAKIANVTGKTYVVGDADDDFELNEGKLSDNFAKIKEVIDSIEMVPGESYWIECDDTNCRWISQMFNGDEITIADF